ncbi:hypothetical protein ACOMHN_013202 [Nucella lapillus]
MLTKCPRPAHPAVFTYPLPALRIVGWKKLPGGRGFSNTLTGDYVVVTEPILRNVYSLPCVDALMMMVSNPGQPLRPSLPVAARDAAGRHPSPRQTAVPALGATGGHPTGGSPDQRV